MKDPTVFGFYGASDTGKTSLIERVIKQLSKEGFSVASIKITDKNIGIDTKGKDTWRHSQAGSKLVVLSSPVETDFLLKESIDIDETLQHINEFGDYDVILVEGACDPSIPKIRLGEDIEKRRNTVISYKGDFKEIIKMVKNEINQKKNEKEELLSIKVNGKQIPLTEFPSNIIKNTILGMLSSLKGVDKKIDDFEIRFKK